jgi:uncharacterized SAM-binding protein YcdF (DUF218 family)
MELLLKILVIPLYPLGLGITVIGTGLVLVYRKVHWGKTVILSGLILLYVISTPFVSRLFLRPLEAPYEQQGKLPGDCSAIVVLGGSGKAMYSRDEEPEFNEAGDRLLHAARLFRMGLAPRVVTSGGFGVGSFHQEVTEGEQNAMILEEMGVPDSVIIIERRSLTTADHGPTISALFDSLQLRKRVVLVTSAAHMYRSIQVFKKSGFTVYPSATDFQSRKEVFNGVKDFFPEVSALFDVTAAIHEVYGIVGYKLLRKM